MMLYRLCVIVIVCFMVIEVNGVESDFMFMVVGGDVGICVCCCFVFGWWDVVMWLVW